MYSELDKGIINMFKNLSGLREQMKYSKTWQREYSKFINEKKTYRNPFKWHAKKNYRKLTISIDNYHLSDIENDMNKLSL